MPGLTFSKKGTESKKEIKLPLKFLSGNRKAKTPKKRKKAETPSLRAWSLLFYRSY